MEYRLIEKKGKDKKVYFQTELKVALQQENSFHTVMLIKCMDAVETRRSSKFIYYLADGDWLNKRGGAYGKKEK